MRPLIRKKIGEIINAVFQDNDYNVVLLKEFITENKGESDLLNIFHEIIDEIKQIELNNKIERLETKVAKEMDQKLYDELLSLKSHLKSG